MFFEPSNQIQDFLPADAYGGVNPSITDSSTYTFRNPQTMKELFEHDIEGCFLYSRHWNPINKSLAQALALMEGSEAAQVTASGMAAISGALLQLCNAGDEIISGRTIYGGSYALFKNFLPRLGICTRFVNLQDLAAVEAAISERTKVIYCESVSNPLLEIANISALGQIAKRHGLTLVVDNTFSPMILSPIQLGADVVVHSLTKFINGSSDCVAGVVCGSQAFISRFTDVNAGASMLLGPVLDSFRSAGILKNLHTLHIRMSQHSYNALYLATRLEEVGVRVFYPGLASHPQHGLMVGMMNKQYGFGGMMAIDTGREEAANDLMSKMQAAKVGHLAVSLGYFKTLFSSPGNSTSSEIPLEEREAMGLSNGLIRLSVGLDQDIERTFERIAACL